MLTDVPRISPNKFMLFVVSARTPEVRSICFIHLGSAGSEASEFAGESELFELGSIFCAEALQSKHYTRLIRAKASS